jgi:N6-L-threonylcarbamoyladenine synthase
MYLAIESSCDETSIAIFEYKEPADRSILLNTVNNIKVLSSVISSQINVHKKYGGVIPEIGAREHAKNIHKVFEESLSESKLNQKFFLSNLEGIFVTDQPGLSSALQVGIEFAKILRFWVKIASKRDIPIHQINHLHGHVASSFYNSKYKSSNQEIFPHLHLLVSGGNTQLILLNSWQQKTILGQTLDDAVGECLDKIGRMLGLPYPGGVWISKIAKDQKQNPLSLPVGMKKNTKSLDFSYSGLKTAVRYLVQKQKFPGWGFEKKLSKEDLNILLQPNNQQLPDYLDFIYQVCISSQSVAIEQLINSIKRSIKANKIKSIGLSGGVSANQLLRKELESITENLNLKFTQLKDLKNQSRERQKTKIFLPPLELTGDNAVMIGLAGIFNKSTI